MTIREHFQRVQKRVTYVLVPVVLLAITLFRWRYPQASQSDYLILGAVLAGIMIPALYFVLRSLYLCPRCSANFFQLRREEGLRRDPRNFWDIWDKCPRCGVSFDDPWG